jgi:hypothetical protein
MTWWRRGESNSGPRLLLSDDRYMLFSYFLMPLRPQQLFFQDPRINRLSHRSIDAVYCTEPQQVRRLGLRPNLVIGQLRTQLFACATRLQPAEAGLGT